MEEGGLQVRRMILVIAELNHKLAIHRDVKCDNRNWTWRRHEERLVHKLATAYAELARLRGR
jgi:hypothetical protein